jgi:hypothetical protein
MCRGVSRLFLRLRVSAVNPRYDIFLYCADYSSKKIKIMVRKPGLGPLLLAGIAAFGAYKYSQMSEQQKKSLVNKGKRVFDDSVGGLKNMFGGKGNTATNGNSYSPQG